MNTTLRITTEPPATADSPHPATLDPTTTLADTARQRDTRAVVVGGVIGAAAAVLASSVIYFVGMAGAPIRVVTGWAPDGADLTYAEVTITAAVSVIAGAALLGWWQRRRANAWRRWVAAAAAVTILSAVPLWRLDVDTGSKLSLTLMHAATGIAAIAGHAVTRRHQRRGATA